MFILEDNYFRHLQMSLNKCLESNVENYTITSLLKSAAPVKNLIETINLLSEDFTFRDLIIVTRGSNDFNNNETPLKMIFNKLKLCVHINIFNLSVPISKYHTH